MNRQQKVAFRNGNLRFSLTVAAIAIVLGIGLIAWLFSVKATCGQLDYVKLDAMDSATKQFYFTNCK